MKKTSKNVLIVDSNETNRTALSMMLREMGIRTFEARDGAEAMNTVRTRKLNLIITNLLLSKIGGVELLRNVQKIRPETEYITLSDTVNGAVYDYMRMLGVFRLFQVPFSINEVKDTVLRALSSKRIDRLMTEDRTSHLELKEHLRVIAALSEIETFRRVLEIGLSEGIEVDQARDQHEFLKMLKIGLYDFIITEKSFIDKLNPKEVSHLFDDRLKPVIFVLSDSEQAFTKGEGPHKLEIHYLPMHFKKNDFLKALKEILPQYLYTKEKFLIRKKRRKSSGNIFTSFINTIKYHCRVVKKTALCLYLILIVLAGLIGFLTSSFMDRGQGKIVKSGTSETEMLEKLQDYNIEDLKKLKEQLGK